MPGPARQDCRERRRRTGARLGRFIQEATRAPVGAPAVEGKWIAAQGAHVAPEVQVADVVHAVQAIMLGTRLEEDMWREAIEYAWHVHNLLCLTRNASPEGNGPRPLTQISDNNIDQEECDRRKDYSIPPGSLLCHGSIWAILLKHSHRRPPRARVKGAAELYPIIHYIRPPFEI